MKNIHTKALFYSGTLFLVVLSILAIAATVFVMRGNKSYNENTISVDGTAEILAQPDIARFSFSVEETTKDPKEGQEVISEKISKILRGLKDLEVKNEDIKTKSYTITPKYEWVKVTDNQTKVALSGERYTPNQKSKRVQVGYDVSQEIYVSLRNLDNASGALVLFAENGVENLSGPTFDIEDIDELKVKARLKAIEIAKEKAKRISKELDVKLGKIVSFHEDKGGRYLPQANYSYLAKEVMLEGASADSASPELPAGENEIISTVTVTYKIK